MKRALSTVMTLFMMMASSAVCSAAAVARGETVADVVPKQDAADATPAFAYDVPYADLNDLEAEALSSPWGESNDHKQTEPASEVDEDKDAPGGDIYDAPEDSGLTRDEKKLKPVFQPDAVGKLEARRLRRAV